MSRWTTPGFGVVFDVMVADPGRAWLGKSISSLKENAAAVVEGLPL
jgi:hypothetical protein